MSRPQPAWRVAACRIAVAGAVLAVTVSTAGCAPHALGFEPEGSVAQGVPMVPAHAAYGGVDLDNSTGSSVVLQSLQVTGIRNAKVSQLRVIRETTGNGIGFYYPPLTAAMHPEMAHAQPLQGFTLPAHSRNIYEAVFLLSAIDPAKDASSRTAIVTYRTGASSWSETKHTSFCLYVRPDHGCDRT